MWAVFSTLVELPPILRSSYGNIIFHSSWTGSNPDFNVYFNMESILIIEFINSKFIFLLLTRLPELRPVT
jgi:hypothetical protein